MNHLLKINTLQSHVLLDNRDLALYQAGVDMRGNAFGTLTGEALLAAAKWG